MRADDIHFLRVSAADLGAVHLFARPIGRGLGIEFAQYGIGLLLRIFIHRHRPHVAAHARIAHILADFPARDHRRKRRGRTVIARRLFEDVFNPLGIGTAVTLELRLDPVNRRAVAVGALPAIAELGQALDGGLVLGKFQTADHGFDGVDFGGLGLGEGGRGRNNRQADGEEDVFAHDCLGQGSLEGWAELIIAKMADAGACPQERNRFGDLAIEPTPRLRRTPFGAAFGTLLAWKARQCWSLAFYGESQCLLFRQRSNHHCHPGFSPGPNFPPTKYKQNPPHHFPSPQPVK